MAFKTLKAKLRQRKLRSHAIVVESDLSKQRFGARSGVWTVHPDVLGPQSVIYSFGVGDNIAWDLAMIETYGLELHAFDPTPRSIGWMSRQALPASFHFHSYGLADFAGEIELFEPRKERNMNYTSRAEKKGGTRKITCPVRRFGSIAQDLGHSHIDVLKLDIEGAEVEALPDVLESGISIGQLLVEFHYNYPSISFASTLERIAGIRKAGFKIFDISDRAYEFSFVHADTIQAGLSRSEGCGE
jgi:FkbM family methyltransferase